MPSVNSITSNSDYINNGKRQQFNSKKCIKQDFPFRMRKKKLTRHATIIFKSTREHYSELGKN